MGTTTYTYRLNGWLSKVVYDYSASGLANAQELDYGYNADGTLASLTWKNGSAVVGTWTYGYDAGGRLTSVSNPFGETTTWTYDGESKLLTQSNTNGTSTAYAYNQQRGWPTSITHYSGATAFASYGLTYDNGNNTVGNLTGVTEADGSTVSYGYDALYRLTGEARTGAISGGHTFGYDLAGNLTSLDSSTATYDAANKITNSGFSYDGDGDLLSDGVNSYAWDDRSNLVSRTAGGFTTAYGYDARGLRVVSQVGLGIKTFYIFAGDTLLGEINGAGVVQAAYTWDTDGLVSERIVPSGKSLWYHFGPQGETRQLTDGTGNVADSYVYSAYGQPVASTGTDANPFRFGGKYGYYTDAGATGGAILCTHRWYDPNTARWLSRDPIGYEGGDNLYAYCLGNPVNWADPCGYDAVAVLNGGLKLGGGALLFGGGPEDPVADGAAGVIVIGTVVVAGGVALGDYLHDHPIHWPSWSPPWAAPPSHSAPPTVFPRPAPAPVLPIHIRPGAGSSLPGPKTGGPPNGSLSEDLGNGKGTIRDYGPDGKPIKDTDFGHDHGSGDPHCHDWKYPPGGKPIRGPGRPIKLGE